MVLKAHTYADLFPMMPDDQFAQLCEDIAKNGLREPITLFEGMILDGRNRNKACEKLGIQPITRPWNGKGSPLDYVISKNLTRRHLSETQRAMVAAKIATLQHGDNQFKQQDAPIGASSQPISQPAAAKLLNVSRRSVQRATEVRDHGIPQLQEEVEAGRVSVTAAAEVARLPAEQQEKIVSGGRKQIIEAAQTVKKEKPKHSPAMRERIGRQRINGQLWGQLRDGLNLITGLPLAHEVAAIARAHDRTGLVDERLSDAIEWMKDFQDAWNAGRSEDAA